MMGSSFQTLGAATEKASLPKLSFVLGTISCEIDGLSCLGIFGRYKRQAKVKVEMSNSPSVQIQEV